MVTAPDLIALFVEPLEPLGVSYMITGGVASVIYGDPRFTRDIDLVMRLDSGDAERLSSAFAGGDFYVPPLEVLVEEASRPAAGHFNIIHRDTALRADVYLARGDALHSWAFPRRRRMRVDTVELSVAPLEYVILRKLEYFRASGSDRHLRDISMMLRISGDLLDGPALEEWLVRLGVVETFGRARGYGEG